jgi:hypothetical protein
LRGHIEHIGINTLLATDDFMIFKLLVNNDLMIPDKLQKGADKSTAPSY